MASRRSPSSSRSSIPLLLRLAAATFDGRLRRSALAYVVMALGLNIVVGFAGLLDLGYVAFFAIGAYTIGWFGSGFFANVNDGKGIHIGVSGVRGEAAGHPPQLPDRAGRSRSSSTAIAGMLIGLPTLRLRGDYIAIVTLAFGEIIGRIAVNGDAIKHRHGHAADRRPPGHHAGRQDRPAVPRPVQPARTSDRGTGSRSRWSLLVLFVNFRLRDSRLGRAWIALREDEVAAVAHGRPARSRRSCWPTRTGAAFGGMAGAFLGSYLNTVNADQFQFYFSIFVLAHGHPRRPRLDLGRRARRDRAVVHQHLPDPGRAQRRCRASSGSTSTLTQITFGDLRLPARDHDDPAARRA